MLGTVIYVQNEEADRKSIWERNFTGIMNQRKQKHGTRHYLDNKELWARYLVIALWLILKFWLLIKNALLKHCKQ